jgi:mycothione reductase
VIAAGARPYLPPVPGLLDVPFHTTDSIMRVERLPEHLIIVGGGFVAAELGHVFAALGSRVSVVHRGGRLLRHEDHDVSVRFTERFGRRVHLHLDAEVAAVRHAAGEFTLDLDVVGAEGPTGRALTGDALLVCTGRVPNADQLGLEHTDVRRTPAGYIVTDDTLATSQAGVWAIGDVRNPRQLKHLANHEAAVVAHNLLHPEALRSIDERAVPHAVFSDPQIGSVGAREEDLRAAGIDHRVGRRDYGGVAYGWALDDDSSFAKVLVDAGSDLILGAHVIGPQAATLVQQFVTAMRFGIPAASFARDQLWCHPALSEVVENAVLDATG